MTILKTEDNVYLEVIGGNIRNCFSEKKELLNIVNVSNIEMEYQDKLKYIKETIKETFKNYSSEKEIEKILTNSFNKKINIDYFDLKIA